VGCNQNAAEQNCEGQWFSQLVSAAFWVCCAFCVLSFLE
jgi:hypothetical protein